MIPAVMEIYIGDLGGVVMMVMMMAIKDRFKSDGGGGSGGGERIKRERNGSSIYREGRRLLLGMKPVTANRCFTVLTVTRQLPAAA